MIKQLQFSHLTIFLNESFYITILFTPLISITMLFFSIYSIILYAISIIFRLLTPKILFNYNVTSHRILAFNYFMEQIISPSFSSKRLIENINTADAKLWIIHRNETEQNPQRNQILSIYHPL